MARSGAEDPADCQASGCRGGHRGCRTGSVRRKPPRLPVRDESSVHRVGWWCGSNRRSLFATYNEIASSPAPRNDEVVGHCERSEAISVGDPDDLSSDAGALDDLFLTQLLDLTRADSEPTVQDLGAVLSERRRSFEPHGPAVDPHRPSRHLVVTVVVMDGLHKAALLEARLALQFHGVEYRSGRHSDSNQPLHRLALLMLARPVADDRVQFLFVLDAEIAGREARSVDQILAPDQLHQPRPVLRVGPTGGQVDIIVGSFALARIEARWSVVAAARFGAAARRRLAGARHRRKTGAHVMDHRVLHCHLQPPPLASAIALMQRTEDRGRHQHAGSGVAKAEAGFDRRPVGLAGDRYRAAGGLCD